VYPFLIAIAVSLSVSLSLLLIPERPFYFLGPFLGVVALVPTFVLVRRRVGDKVQPFFEKAQRLAEGGDVDKAVEALRESLAWKRWQLFLEKQVNTQVGVLYYAAGKEKDAVEHLKQGYPKLSEGHLILGSILHRQGKKAEAYEALEHGIRFNKRSPILYNVLAWLLDKDRKREEAVAVLERSRKKCKGDEQTTENLERLRASKRMNMKPFGQLWYTLKFETPKGMGIGAAPFRKGFRQPPKNKGKKGKGKKAKSR